MTSSQMLDRCSTRCSCWMRENWSWTNSSPVWTRQHCYQTEAQLTRQLPVAPVITHLKHLIPVCSPQVSLRIYHHSYQNSERCVHFPAVRAHGTMLIKQGRPHDKVKMCRKHCVCATPCVVHVKKSQENTKFMMFLAVDNQLFSQSGVRAFSLDHLA